MPSRRGGQGTLSHHYLFLNSLGRRLKACRNCKANTSSFCIRLFGQGRFISQDKCALNKYVFCFLRVFYPSVHSDLIIIPAWIMLLFQVLHLSISEKEKYHKKSLLVWKSKYDHNFLWFCHYFQWC